MNLGKAWKECHCYFLINNFQCGELKKLRFFLKPFLSFVIFLDITITGTFIKLNFFLGGAFIFNDVQK